MRILHVDTGRDLRGGQRQVLLLLEGLRAAGVDCQLLSSADSPLFRNAASAGFDVRAAGLRTLRDLSKTVDLLHAHDAKAHTMCAIAARAPFVVSRRVAFAVKRSLLSEWKYRQASRFLAVSQSVARELERCGTRGDKIDVVYDGVQPGLPPALWAPGSPAVALASSDPAKGRDLVEDAARLANQPVIYSNDLTKDLLRASMFIYLTRSEGLGSAAILAMAMGIPVIASEVGGLTEVLSKGKAGLLVPNNPPRIAEQIQLLREDSALAQTLIERGKQQVAELFTAEHMVASTLASYRRVLAV